MKNTREVTTRTVSARDVDVELIRLIRADAAESGENATWSVPLHRLFLNEQYAEHCRCTIIALPRYRASDVPPHSDALVPVASTFEWGQTVCFMLRGDKILIPEYVFLHCNHILYLFEDEMSLDTVIFTPSLREEINFCSLATQSKSSPSYRELKQMYPDFEVHQTDDIFKNYYLDEDDQYELIPTPKRAVPEVDTHVWEDSIPF